MPEPNLDETTWQRATAEAERVWHSTAFAVVAALVDVLVISAAVVFTADSGTATQTQIAVPIMAGVIALILSFGSVLVFQLAAAPRRQRDELRAAWPTDPAPPSINVRRKLLQFRQIARNWQNARRFYDQETMPWASEVAAFLSEHGTEDEAERFVGAPSVGEQIVVLDQIIEERR